MSCIVSIFTHLHLVAVVVPAHEVIEEGVISRHGRDGGVIGVASEHAPRGLEVPPAQEISGLVL